MLIRKRILLKSLAIIPQLADYLHPGKKSPFIKNNIIESLSGCIPIHVVKSTPRQKGSINSKNHT